MKRNVHLVVLSITLLGIGLVLALGGLALSAAPRGDAKKGETLYTQKCAVCHGPAGKGDGPAEFVLFPKPRDLSSGKFKIRSTPTLPTDDDLFRVISLGIPGTAMPSWSVLTEVERWDLVAYVKSLSPGFTQQTAVKPGRIPPSPKPTPALLALGKKFYAEAECLTCHGGRPAEETATRLTRSRTSGGTPSSPTTSPPQAE